MPKYDYRILNVFTQGRATFSGNPLCVFERAQGLDTARMQALALQFNLSETTFILPSERANACVRIFTPEYEMRFAGHPTLGTAHVCRSLGLGGDRITLELPAGLIPVRASGDRWTLQANEPKWREVQEPRFTLAAMLGLEKDDIGERPLWVSVGTEQLIVPLASEAAVRRIRVRGDLLSQMTSAEGAERGLRVRRPRRTGLLARFIFPIGTSVLGETRRPALRPRISAAGASPRDARCRANSRSRRESISAGPHRCVCGLMRNAGSSSAAKCTGAWTRLGQYLAVARTTSHRKDHIASLRSARFLISARPHLAATWNPGLVTAGSDRGSGPAMLVLRSHGSLPSEARVLNNPHQCSYPWRTRKWQLLARVIVARLTPSKCSRPIIKP